MCLRKYSFIAKVDQINIKEDVIVFNLLGIFNPINTFTLASIFIQISIFILINIFILIDIFIQLIIKITSFSFLVSIITRDV